MQNTPLALHSSTTSIPFAKAKGHRVLLLPRHAQYQNSPVESYATAPHPSTVHKSYRFEAAGRADKEAIQTWVMKQLHHCQSRIMCLGDQWPHSCYDTIDVNFAVGYVSFLFSRQSHAGL